MPWQSWVWSVVYYTSRPLILLFQLVAIALAPLGHLGKALLTVCLLPLGVVAKFETLYIFIGVAAVVGLIAGCMLFTTSSFLIAVLSLQSRPGNRGRTATSVRAAREQKALDEAWDSSYSRDEIKHKLDPVTEKRYTEWLEKEGKGDQGLLGQIILEEEDSDDFDTL